MVLYRGVERMRIFLLVTILVFYSSLIWADKYTIQVGAFHQISEYTLSSVARYGAYQQEKKGHLIRLMVGSFDTRPDAETLLSEINKSYPEAFVRLVDQHGGDEKHQHYDEETPRHQHPHFNGEEIIKWQSLSEDQRKHAVYLDGRLHLKYGDHFTPVK